MPALLMHTGDAWTPARFWNCEIVNSTDTEKIETLKKQGWLSREATTTECKRGKGKGQVCLGDIADRFFEEA